MLFLSLGTIVQYFDKYSWYHFPDPEELTAKIFTKSVEYMTNNRSSLNFRTALALHLPEWFVSIIASREGLTHQQVNHPNFLSVYQQIQEIRRDGWIDQATEETIIRDSLTEIGLDPKTIDAYLNRKFAATPTTYGRLNHSAFEDQDLYQRVITLIDRLRTPYQRVLYYRFVQHKGEDIPESTAAQDLHLLPLRYRNLLRTAIFAIRQLARREFPDVQDL